MNDKHPITPPPELVHQWADMLSSRSDHAVFSFAAQWGADMELEACVTWLDKNGLGPNSLGRLRDARRPKPPTLKKQALAKLAELESDEPGYKDDLEVLRRALEALPK
jgi:hypothetical protein